jgi:hypothetical protein
MDNLLFSGGVMVQSTALGSTFGDQLITGGVIQETSQACIVDLIAPVFAGVSNVSVGALGQFQVQWGAATDISEPIQYEIYIKPFNSTNLFNTNHISYVTTQLQASIFALGDGSLLQSGVQYFVGVRAIDAIGNRDNNTVIIAKTSPGITGAVNNIISGIFNVDTNNNLIGTFWVTDSDGTITNPLRLGNGSYQIYDKAGVVVSGMSQSGIVPDAEGFYKINPVASVLDLDNNFYAAKVTIPVDDVPVSYNLPIVNSTTGNIYEPRAVFSINAANELQATLWCTKDSELMTSSLGTASFAIYDRNGAAIGISQSGLTANLNGYYNITPVNASIISDLTHYVVKIDLTADGRLHKGSVGITLGE